MLVLLALLTAGITTAAAGTSTSQVRSYAYIAVSRSGAAVYINALVHQNSAKGLISSPNRTVYLQRQLSTGWQNVLQRSTDAHGRFTVGFLSAPSYPYRLIVTATPTAQGANSATMPSPLLGGVLHSGQSLVALPYRSSIINSPSGEFRLGVEQGGNFGLSQDAVFTDIAKIIGGTVQEIDGTPGPPANDISRLTMQTNGDLVLRSSAGAALWSSHTSGAGNALYVQDDGDLVIYNRASRAVWSSHTTPVVLLAGTIIPSGKVYRAQIYPTTSPRYVGRLVMQRDGNLVLFGGTKPTWSSNTHLPGSHAAFTVNGTLAVFSPGGTVLWRSTSYGTYSAVLLDCGRLEFLPRYGDPHEFPSWQVPASCNS